MIRRAIKVYTSIRRRKPEPEKERKIVKNIAYFVEGGIGDGIMALPAINKLRKTFPAAILDVYTRPEICKFISLFLPDYTVKPFHKTDIFLFFLFLKRFFKRYDVSFTSIIAVFNIYIEISSYLLSRTAYGFRYKHESIYDRLYHNSLTVEEKTHDTIQNMGLISQMLDLDITKDDYVIEKKNINLAPHTPSVVFIHPGMKKGYENRSWPIENYRVLIDKLKQTGYSVKIILGPDEENLHTFFSNVNKGDILLSLEPKRLTEELAKSFMFIGNDSGPAHIADYVGIPTIVLFGPADPQRTAPLGKKTVVIYKNKDCSPCHYKSIQCKNNICMRDISIEDVWEKVKYIEKVYKVKRI